MRRHPRTRPMALLLSLVLAFALVACDDADQEAQEDPRGALSEAMASFTEWDGVEMVIGAQLDDEAEASAMDEGEFTEEELALLTDSTLTVRAVQGDGGDDQGESEFELVVGDESVLTLRALAGTQLYALIDLPAIERVAESLDAGGDFQQGISEFEQMAGMFGLGEVVSAARDAEWIHVAGLEQMMDMAEAQTGEEQLDEADMEELAEEVGTRLRAFIDSDDVAVEHVDSDDVGDRIRVTTDGAQLRAVIADLVESFAAVADVDDPTGMGLDVADLRGELEESIPDDVEVSFDAWVDGGELSQIAVDVFSLARSAGEEDVPDGEFLVAIALAEFTDGIEAPDTDVTFDVMEMFGGMLGGMGDLGGDIAPEDGMGDMPDEGMDELPEDGMDEMEMPEDLCLTDEEADELRQQMPDGQDLSDDEIEDMLGVPVC